MSMQEKSFSLYGFQINIIQKSAFKAIGFTRFVKLDGRSIGVFLNELETSGKIKQLFETFNSPQQFWVCLSGNEGNNDYDCRCTVCIFPTEKHNLSNILEKELFTINIPESYWADFIVGPDKTPKELHSHGVYEMVGEIGYKFNNKIGLHFDNEHEFESKRSMHFLLPVII